MCRAEKVFNYYVLFNRLKNVIRTGWKDWNVKRERIESVAEHIYGVQMLAMLMCSEYKIDIDLYKVMTMLALHEVEEIIIGDLTMFQISDAEKQVKGHEVIKEFLKDLKAKDEIEKLIIEFDERKTKEARFAYYCDKLECDLQSKLYDLEGCVDLNNQAGNIAMQNKDVQELLNDGNSWSDMWLKFGQKRYNYDPEFKEVSDYALNYQND